MAETGDCRGWRRSNLGEQTSFAATRPGPSPGARSRSNTSISRERWPDGLRLACVNSALESGIRSPLDDAILAHEHPAIADVTKLAMSFLSISSDDASVDLLEHSGWTSMMTKGSPEAMLDLCTLGTVGYRPVRRSAAVNRTRHSNGSAWRLTTSGGGPKQHHLARTAWPPPKSAISRWPGSCLPGSAARTVAETLPAAGGRGPRQDSDRRQELITRTICEQVGVTTERIVLG